MEWLDDMLRHKPWRKVVYLLCEQHPDCHFLHHAIQRISDMGYQREITHLSSVATRLGVFNNVLMNLMEELFQLDKDSMQYEKKLGDFIVMPIDINGVVRFTHLQTPLWLEIIIGKRVNISLCAVVTASTRGHVKQRK